jgi:hypothetical protein
MRDVESLILDVPVTPDGPEVDVEVELAEAEVMM